VQKLNKIPLHGLGLGPELNGPIFFIDVDEDCFLGPSISLGSLKI